MKTSPLLLLLLLFTGAFSACEKDCVEKRKENCVCITLYDPVCGCNDVTYGNGCEAECSGITDYVKGPCK